MKSYFYIEGKKYKKDDFPKKFVEESYFVKNFEDTYTLKFCGIVNYKKKFYIFFPKGYRIEQYSEKENIENAKLLFKSILQYRDSVTLDEYEYNWLGNKNSNIEHINIITWIIQDYFTHGIYIDSKKKYEINGKGSIDWNNTINKTTPILKNNKTRYMNFITKKSTYNTDNQISQIHESIILECLHDFGWLFNFHPIKKRGSINTNTNQQIIILKKKLRDTFSTREIKLLQYLITYLQKNKSNGKNYVIITPYFNNIWEKMLQQLISPNTDLLSTTPKPYWKLPRIKQKQYTRQIPDILIQYNNDLIIIDAKYYSIESNKTSKFPGWESIVKQLYYSLSLKNENYNEIKNIFLFPQTLQDKTYHYIGFTAVEGKENELGHIKSFSIDIRTVLKGYLQIKQRTFLDTLVNQYDEISKKIDA